ncbi:MAG: methyltransferase domain-containing protein, partial [Rhodospirillaceae bacterium]|nr:methyltransferase domain-containing protein [Rhodospirillaceae bacterium]
QVFDRNAVRAHRERAAKKTWAEHDFLFMEAAERLCDRLDDVKRDFDTALDLGCHGGCVAKNLNGRGNIKNLTQTDISPAMVALAEKTGHSAMTTAGMVVDEENLPFDDGSFDLVLSNLSLHWVNDLPGALIQIRKSLKPDGLMLASVFAERTLWELRESLMAAEIEIEGGMSPRVSPFATVQDLGSLLGRAGFALPVLDTDTITVSYPDAFKLMADLRGMGESSAVSGRRKTFTREDTILRAARYYQEKFAGGDGRIPATFDIVTMTAWAPGPNQPQPLKPGTAKINLNLALNDGAEKDKKG